MQTTLTNEVEVVAEVSTSARLLTFLKENRIEMIGLVIVAHLLGVSDKVLAQVSGVCF